ncbi:MAG: Omp28-related outer membrane protein [Bacteroidota bacterium]|nr:Omp28-related outer membrane protein [Bacteroidota bacterium]MDP4233611.1 Omp28-related outer membrane protein [Bacteroidota bacterium]MDP4243129.1 Omp28-related outer membrane protein [Bacteroidota bacterium]MDP4288539.1 Omp28-related outer membrane protein [Bacteroidota bacterium]
MLNRSLFFLGACALIVVAAPSRILAQPKVLAELFSNTNCGPCADADNKFDAFMAANPTYGIVRINYHNDIANPLDTFYKASQSSSFYRSSSVYGISTDPTGIINGQPSGSVEGAWEALSKTKGIATTPIQLSDSTDADGVIHIRVQNSVRPGTSCRLFVAVTESHIVMDNSHQAYGNPPSGYWDDILRVMLPSPQGSSPFTPTGSDTYDFSFDPTIPDYWGKLWNPENMQAIAFLQDDQGTVKKVEAIGVLSLAIKGAVTLNAPPNAHLRLFANPTPRLSQVGITLPYTGRVRVTLSDMLGRSVRTLVDGMMPQGESSIELDGSLPAGCYVIRMFVDGTETDHAKVIVR